ncbi:MAG: PEGA domain-containing protein, partial [Lachnospiraceae bacterium]|nr:PEGA domain-containing protein [Lachnospiraceae bacterium]
MFIRVCGGRKKSEKFVSTKGSVTVTANISGASIKIVTGSKIVATGTAIGNTVTTEKIPAGTYEVIVSKAGFADEKQIVIVDGDVNINVTLVELPIEASAISEITTNTAKVVLAATPARELTAADFKVTGNTVTKIEKGNFDTVYTLTLGTSLDNTKGTLTVNGASKDYDFTQLKINSVKAKNLRQLEVTFSKELNVTGSPAADGTYTKNELLENLHIWMTKEEDGATKTNSIENIVGTNSTNWTAYVLSDKKTVVIESKDGSKLTDAANTGLGLKLNETYEVEALDVVDASGKFSDVSYMTDILQDTVRPSVKDYDKSVVKNGTLNINFTEPMSELKGANSKAKVYLDGKDVTTSITDVTKNDTVALHSKISIATTDLDKGEHTFAIVGAEDLNGNVLSDNTKEYTFKITDPADPAEAVTPVVTDIQQIADNAFKVVFNTKFVGVKGADASNNTNVIATIKNGAFNTSEGANGAYKDIELKKADMKAEDVPATATTPAHTEWTFVVDATATTSNTDDGRLAYKSANIMNKEIVIDNFATKSGSITSDTDLKFGKETTKSLTFKKDTTAPVISSATDAITSVDKVITIKFNDAPFAGDAANIEYTAGKKATVKYVNEEGVTYSEEIIPALGDDKKSIKLTVTNNDMLSADGSKLIAGGKYSIVLPDALVKVTEEDSVITTPKYMLLVGQHPFVGTSVYYTVPGAAAVIGSV